MTIDHENTHTFSMSKSITFNEIPQGFWETYKKVVSQFLWNIFVKKYIFFTDLPHLTGTKHLNQRTHFVIRFYPQLHEITMYFSISFI